MQKTSKISYHSFRNPKHKMLKQLHNIFGRNIWHNFRLFEQIDEGIEEGE